MNGVFDDQGYAVPDAFAQNLLDKSKKSASSSRGMKAVASVPRPHGPPKQQKPQNQHKHLKPGSSLSTPTAAALVTYNPRERVRNISPGHNPGHASNLTSLQILCGEMEETHNPRPLLPFTKSKSEVALVPGSSSPNQSSRHGSPNPRPDSPLLSRFAHTRPKSSPGHRAKSPTVSKLDIEGYLQDHFRSRCRDESRDNEHLGYPAWNTLHSTSKRPVHMGSE